MNQDLYRQIEQVVYRGSIQANTGHLMSSHTTKQPMLGVAVERQLGFHRPRSSQFSKTFMGRKFEDTTLDNATRLAHYQDVKDERTLKKLEEKQQRIQRRIEEDQKRKERAKAREAGRLKRIWEQEQLLKETTLVKQEHKDATTMQKLARGFLARRRVTKMKELKYRDLAAIKIQTHARGQLARRKIHGIKHQLSNEKQVRHLSKERKASIQIQKLCRGYIARKRLQSQRAEDVNVNLDDIVDQHNCDVKEREVKKREPSPVRLMHSTPLETINLSTPEIPKDKVRFKRVGGGFSRMDEDKSSSLRTYREMGVVRNQFTSPATQPFLTKMKRQPRTSSARPKSEVLDRRKRLVRDVNEEALTNLFHASIWAGNDQDILQLWLQKDVGRGVLGDTSSKKDLNARPVEYFGASDTLHTAPSNQASLPNILPAIGLPTPKRKSLGVMNEFPIQESSHLKDGREPECSHTAVHTTHVEKAEAFYSKRTPMRPRKAIAGALDPSPLQTRHVSAHAQHFFGRKETHPATKQTTQSTKNGSEQWVKGSPESKHAISKASQLGEEVSKCITRRHVGGPPLVQRNDGTCSTTTTTNVPRLLGNDPSQLGKKLSPSKSIDVSRKHRWKGGKRFEIKPDSKDQSRKTHNLPSKGPETTRVPQTTSFDESKQQKKEEMNTHQVRQLLNSGQASLIQNDDLSSNDGNENENDEDDDHASIDTLDYIDAIDSVAFSDDLDDDVSNKSQLSISHEDALEQEEGLDKYIGEKFDSK